MNVLREVVELGDPGLTTEEALRFELLASRIEDAYDAGQALTAPLPLFGGNQLLPDDQYVWTKPLLVLIDELAGSCGDMVKAAAALDAPHRASGASAARPAVGGRQAAVRCCI